MTGSKWDHADGPPSRLQVWFPATLDLNSLRVDTRWLLPGGGLSESQWVVWAGGSTSLPGALMIPPSPDKDGILDTFSEGQERAIGLMLAQAR